MKKRLSHRGQGNFASHTPLTTQPTIQTNASHCTGSPEMPMAFNA